MGQVEERSSSAFSWMRDAACQGMSFDIFFPTKGQDTKRAKEICAQCPVIHECLEYVLSLPHHTQGVWAGTTEQERSRPSKRRELRKRMGG